MDAGGCSGSPSPSGDPLCWAHIRQPLRGGGGWGLGVGQGPRWGGNQCPPGGSAPATRSSCLFNRDPLVRAWCHMSEWAAVPGLAGPGGQQWGRWQCTEMPGGTRWPWLHVDCPSLEAGSCLWTREDPEEGGLGRAGGGRAGGGRAGQEGGALPTSPESWHLPTIPAAVPAPTPAGGSRAGEVWG